MLTRRGFLAGMAAIGVLPPKNISYEKASQPSTPVDFDVPNHSCDSHVHYYGDPQKFPLAPQHKYTPEGTTPEEMLEMHRALHIELIVIVTPGPYDADNSTTLYAMKALGPSTRGIAVINDKTLDGDLDAMYRAGIRGARIISGTSGPSDPAAARPIYQMATKRLPSHRWHIQMYTNLAVISNIKDLVHSSTVPTVFDHFGGAQADLGLHQPGFSDLLELVRSGSAYVKVSGVYRASTKAPDYRDVVPLAKALIEANPDRILWGSDWPHPNSSPSAVRKPSDVMQLYQLDDGHLLNQLRIWAPDPGIRQKILVDNPARLFGY
jgi:predicted TIM-barrel fold metal-dependent hydrolase